MPADIEKKILTTSISDIELDIKNIKILKMNIQDTKLLNILVSKLECLRY